MRSRGSKSKLFLSGLLSLHLLCCTLSNPVFNFLVLPLICLPLEKNITCVFVCIYIYTKMMNSDLGCQVLLTLWIRLFYRLHVEVLNSEPRLSHVLFDSPNSALLLFALLLVFFCFHFRCFHFDFQTLLWNYSEQEKIKGVWSSMSRLKKLSKPSVGKGTQTKEMENPTACGQLEFGGPFISVLGTRKLGRLMVPSIVYLLCHK